MRQFVKLFSSIFLTIIILLLNPSKLYSLTIAISDFPSSIEKTQEVEVQVYLECAGCNDSYLRGVFFPSGTNYFGFTQNNSGEWVGHETDRTKYFKVAKTDLVEASWSGQLKVKLDLDHSAFTGPGQYTFKVGRYTSSSNSSATWSNELGVLVTGPTITPTPTSTPSPSPTSSATFTPKPSSTPTPTKSANLATNKPVSTKNIETTSSPSATQSALPSVLGLETKTTTLTPIPKNVESKSGSFLGLIFIGSGVLFIVGSVVFAIKSPALKSGNDI